MPSIRSVIEGLYASESDEKVDVSLDQLEAALLSREDSIVGYIVGAGAQFGMYPQIVAEVVAAIGIGTPPSEEERALIHTQFVNLMEQLNNNNNG